MVLHNFGDDRPRVKLYSKTDDKLSITSVKPQNYGNELNMKRIAAHFVYDFWAIISKTAELKFVQNFLNQL